MNDNKNVEDKKSIFASNDEYFENKYGIKEEIASGRYGCVYLGKNKYNNEKRAIKIYKKNDIKELVKNLFTKKEEIETIYKSIIKDFINELENMKLMNVCDNSVKYYDYFEDEDEIKIIMELCDDNLYNLLQKKQFIFVEIYEIIHQLNNAFREMNKNNIIHGNIKLQNFLVKYENKEKTKFKLKLGDYGSDILISYILRNNNKEDFNNLSQLLNEKGNNQKEKDKHPFFNENLPNDIDPNIFKYKDDEEKEKSDLWKLGISIYKLIFNTEPFQIIDYNDEYQKIILQPQKINDIQLNDLIKILLEKDIKKEKSWDMYFNHSFCNENLYALNYNYNNGQRLDINTIEINFSNKKISSLLYFTNIDFNKLKILNLSTNNIANINEIENIKCTQLENLDLSNNKIKNIERIANWEFKYLNSLNLSYNEIEEIKVFSNKNVLPNLKLLLLNNNKINLKEKKGLIEEINKSRGNNINIDIILNAKSYENMSIY